jgi:hypothetical protein
MFIDHSQADDRFDLLRAVHPIEEYSTVYLQCAQIVVCKVAD